MLKTSEKNKKTKLEVFNSITFQDDAELAEKGKGQHFTSRFIEPGIAEYKGSFGKILITKDTLDKFIKTIVGVPVIIKHKDITEKNVNKERVGVVSDVWFNEADGWYYCSGILFDRQAIDLVKNQGWSVSCTYDFESDFKKGTYHGLDYDMEFTGGEFLHLALVPNPRYEKANIVMNSKGEVMLAENEEHWITIGADEEKNRKGTHILVKDGETNKEATERKIAEWKGQKGEKKEAPKVQKDEKKTEEYKKQMLAKYQEAATPEEKKAYLDYVNKETEKWADDVNYKEAADWLNEHDKSDVFGKEIEPQEQPKEQPQEDKQPESPFGEGVSHKHIDSGMFYKSKGTDVYTKGNRGVSVEEFGENGGKYNVSFYEGTKRVKTSKTYGTKNGMEKAVREHLNEEANKETKALATKTDLETAKTNYKDVLGKYNAASRKRWQDGISSEEYHQAWQDYEKYKKELTTARREYAESIMSNFVETDNNPYQDKIDAKRGYYQEKSADLRKSSERNWQLHEDTRLPLGQPIINPATARAYKRTNGYFDKSMADYNKSNYYAEKAQSYGSHGISADDANAIAKLAKKYQSGVTSAEKRRIIDRVIDIHTRSTETRETPDTSDLGFQVERNKDINRLQLKFDGKPDEKTRSILKSNGFRWSPREGAWQRQLNGNAEYSLKRISEQLKADNSLLNDIETIIENHIPEKEDINILKALKGLFE